MTESKKICLIEDNKDHAFLFRSILERRTDVMVDHYSTGVKALKALNEFSDEDLPEIVLLDLNLPELSGFEVLQALKQSTAFKFIPVVVLTTSTRSEEIERAYELGCNAYVTKPLEFSDLKRVLKDICEFWADTARLPNRGDRDA